VFEVLRVDIGKGDGLGDTFSELAVESSSEEGRIGTEKVFMD
jgi:hypothetical protein